jgi:hypothetical protein
VHRRGLAALNVFGTAVRDRDPPIRDYFRKGSTGFSQKNHAIGVRGQRALKLIPGGMLVFPPSSPYPHENPALERRHHLSNYRNAKARTARISVPPKLPQASFQKLEAICSQRLAGFVGLRCASLSSAASLLLSGGGSWRARRRGSRRSS